MTPRWQWACALVVAGTVGLVGVNVTHGIAMEVWMGVTSAVWFAVIAVASWQA